MIPLTHIRRRERVEEAAGVSGASGVKGAPGTAGVAPDRPTGGPLAAAWDALATVCDPELGVDLVALGLVYDVREEDGAIAVTMTLTTPGCPASESLPAMARAAVEEAAPGTGVRVALVWDPPWSPAMITGEAAAALGFTSG